MESSCRYTVALRPLRVHLLILVLGAMLPGMVLTGVLVWRAFANNRALAERRLVDSARVDAAALDREFAGAINVLQALATSPTLDSGDLAAFHAEGQRIQSTQPGWYTVVLGSLDGQQLVSTRVPWGAPLLRSSSPRAFTACSRHARRPSASCGGRQAAGRSSSFRFACRSSGTAHLKYTLSAIVNVDSLTRVVPRQLPEEWTRSILDSEGTIAVRTRGAEKFVGARASEAFLQRLHRSPEMVSRETTREGVPVYAATSRNTYGWTSVIVVPSSASSMHRSEPR